MKKLDIVLPYRVRISMPLAQTLVNEFAQKQSFRIKPRLARVQENVGNNLNVLSYRYEGGFVVRLEMYNDNNSPLKTESWVIVGATVRRTNGGEVVEIERKEISRALRLTCPIDVGLGVRDRTEITGQVYISASGHQDGVDGHIEIDPEPDSGSRLNRCFMQYLTYRKFVEGDLERVKAEAETILSEYLAKNRQ